METIYLGYVHNANRIAKNAEMYADKKPTRFSVTLGISHKLADIPHLLELSYGLYAINESSIRTGPSYQSIDYRRVDLSNL